MSEFLVGIDIGTGSSKGVLATPAGRVVATASRAHSMSLPRPGWAEMDAEQVWWGDVVALCRELVPQAEGGRVAGLCVSGVGPCLLPCDDRLEPLRPGILYGIDGRATQEIEELTERFGAERIVARCGTALSTQAVGPKMLWVRRNEPEVWERAAGWYNSHSFVIARLTGEYVLDHHTASQCDPLYDMHASDWAHDWVEEVAPGIEFPRLAWSDEVVGTVHSAAAEATGLPVGTPVAAGTVDAWAEAFSAGVRRPGDLMLMYGSTMFFIQQLQTFRAEPSLWTTRGVQSGSTTFAAGMSTSGSLTGWLQQLTGGAPFEDLVSDAAATPPGAEGLVVLPYFAGERTPVFDPRARGVILGLTLRHTRGHLYRAALEGIAFGIRQILEIFDAADEPASRVVAVGGGTRGALWTQVVSDVTGRVQSLPAQTIGASYGDALLAAIATGLAEPATDWAVTNEQVEPDPEHRALYDELYGVYRELYPTTRGLVHQLADLEEQQAPRDGASRSPTGSP